MVQSVVLDGADYRHYVHTADGGLRLIDVGTDAAFDTDTAAQAALVMAGKVAGGDAGEMDVAAALIYDAALSTGADGLGGDHAAVSRYLFDKYLAEGAASNAAPVADADAAVTDEGTAVAIDVLGGDTDEDGTVVGVTKIAGTVAVVDEAVTLASGAKATLLADGRIDYDPNGAFAALEAGETGTDTFAYAIEDDDGAEASGEVTVTIDGLGDPVASGLVSGGLVAAFESDAGVAIAGDVVTGWSDGSGSGLDLAASGDPRLVAGATPAGQAAIVLDGQGDWLDRALTGADPLPDGDEARSMYFVVDYEASTRFAGASYGAAVENQAFGLTVNGSGGKLAVQGYGSGRDIVSAVDGVDPVDAGQWFVHSVRYDGTTVRHFIDDTLIAETARDDYATDLARLVIGEEIGGAGNGEPLSVAALLVYDRELTGAEHARTLTYLTGKYLEDAGANAAPEITSGEAFSFVEGDAGLVFAPGATDADGDDVTFSLAGADADAFEFDADGAVAFKAAPAFAVGGDNVYDLELVATDGVAETRQDVSVTVLRDQDGDRVADLVDNAVRMANPDQRDTDGDGLGNVIDADFNGNGFVDNVDLATFRAAFGSFDPVTPASAGADADLDGNGAVNNGDLAIFRALFGTEIDASTFYDLG